MYEKVAKTIAPKRESLQKAESDYQAITIFILLKAILKTAFTSIHPPHPSIQDSKFLTAPSSWQSSSDGFSLILHTTESTTTNPLTRIYGNQPKLLTHQGPQRVSTWEEEPKWPSPQTHLDTSPKSEPTLDLHGRAAPSVEAHHRSVGSDTGRNSGRRLIIKKT